MVLPLFPSVCPSVHPFHRICYVPSINSHTKLPSIAGYHVQVFLSRWFTDYVSLETSVARCIENSQPSEYICYYVIALQMAFGFIKIVKYPFSFAFVSNATKRNPNWKPNVIWLMLSYVRVDIHCCVRWRHSKRPIEDNTPMNDPIISLLNCTIS
jgi:hypothetical protein